MIVEHRADNIISMAKTQFTPKRQSSVSPKRVLQAFLAVGVALWLLSSVIGLIGKYALIHRKVRDLKEEKVDAVEKKEELETMNSFIDSDEGRERILRTKYNVVKPGEGVVVITDTDPIVPPEHKSAVGKWWDSLLRGVGLRGE